MANHNIILQMPWLKYKILESIEKKKKSDLGGVIVWL